MTLQAGIHDAVPGDVYHADPAPEPSLTSTIARVLLSRSPLHAWTQHPRLNEEFERAHDEKFDVGSAVHALLLEGRNGVSIIDAPDWRTKEAKVRRDQARAEGRIPLLSGQWDEVCAMEEAVDAQILDLAVTPKPFSVGKPEQTLVWKDDGGVWCRARLDFLHDDYAAVDDLKTTSRSASPREWSRSIFSMGYDVQAAFYLRGVKALTNVDAEFRLVVCETAPPFAVSVLSLEPAALELANDKVTHAIRKWAGCLESGEWAGYPRMVAYAELPGWAEMQWLEQEAEAV